jgi:protein-histidine pros-kinase
LDLSKIQSGKIELKLENINCNKIIQDVMSTIDAMCKNKNLELSYSAPEKDIMVMADIRTLTQIILNLTTNAVKFTEQGQICIELSPREGKCKNEVVIKIMDSGIGIKPEDQTNIFQAFHQAPTSGKFTEGTGLGLHLSQRLASLMNARIEFESTFGKGSVFSLILQSS